MDRDGVSIRYALREQDRKDILELVEATGVFYKYELPIAVELIDDRLANTDESVYHFVIADIDGKPGGYICFGPITITESRFDVYWIAVNPEHQGKGIGGILIKEAERLMRHMGGTIVYIETSSRDIYTPAREFYKKYGYREVGSIPDFYADNDHKVIFMKRLK